MPDDARQDSRPDTRTEEASNVMTVLGPIEPSALGPTLIHEHLQVDASATFSPHLLPASLSGYVDSRVDDSILDLLHQWPFSLCRDNVVLDDEELAIEELQPLIDGGGTALVDCTTVGLGPQPVALRRIAMATGLHIVQGTGIYVERSHPPWVSRSSQDEIAEFMINELGVGIADTGVRAGVIGEIGTSGYELETGITPAEEKVVRAAGAAAAETGAAVIVHLDPRVFGAYRVIELLEGEGVAPSRMVMAHMDANPVSSYHHDVARLGVFLSYDHFGREYYAGHMQRSYTQDSQRIALLVDLLDRGYERQIVLSQDVCAKIDLARFCGNGYGHVVNRIVPLLKHHGVTEAQIERMLVDNPREILSI